MLSCERECACVRVCVCVRERCVCVREECVCVCEGVSVCLCERECVCGVHERLVLQSLSVSVSLLQERFSYVCPDLVKEFSKYDTDGSKWIKQYNRHQRHQQERVHHRRGIRALPGTRDLLPP